MIPLAPPWPRNAGALPRVVAFVQFGPPFHVLEWVREIELAPMVEITDAGPLSPISRARLRKPPHHFAAYSRAGVPRWAVDCVRRFDAFNAMAEDRRPVERVEEAGVAQRAELGVDFEDLVSSGHKPDRKSVV